MDIREKLVELLAPYMSINACEFRNADCDLANCRTCNARAAADHLLANGVTVQEWIPVEDRLPTKEDAKIMGGYLLAIQNGKKPNVWKWTEVAKYPEFFTYWYSLPTPPKGE